MGTVTFLLQVIQAYLKWALHVLSDWASSKAQPPKSLGYRDPTIQKTADLEEIPKKARKQWKILKA